MFPSVCEQKETVRNIAVLKKDTLIILQTSFLWQAINFSVIALCFHFWLGTIKLFGLVVSLSNHSCFNIFTPVIARTF